MFRLQKRRADQEVKAQELSDDFKRKISELHLQIMSGTLSPQELKCAKCELERLRNRLETRMLRIAAESPRPAHP